MNKKYLIIDFYVDEPACLGVPPFISPYPRYIYGALIDGGINSDDISYLTVDYFRKNNFKILDNTALCIIIGGASVPGKYIGYKIGTVAEIERLLEKNPMHTFAIGGMIRKAIDFNSSNVIKIENDIEKFAFNFTSGFEADEKRSVEEVKIWSVKGSEVVKSHDDFPDIICEIETYRGCPRQTHCLFCTESFQCDIEFRPVNDIISEIDNLVKNGITRFRIGSQPDILCYGSKLKTFKNGFPEPEPNIVIELFSRLKEMRDEGKIKVLNVDNANPGTIINFPEKSKIILKSIADAVTPGDTLPLGVESFDDNVIKNNNLKGSKEQIIDVIKIINEIGGKRVNGIPTILPGINLIQGLLGENDKTFKINYETLSQIKNSGLLVKRINIRKLLKIEGTPIFKEKYKIKQAALNRYDFYKSKIRSEIDTHMLKEIYPAGTILKNLRIEDTHSGYSYARQLQSYSIVCKIPEEIEKKSFIDIIIVGHRERSLSGLRLPLRINKIQVKALELIPGISKKGAADIILKRPFSNINQIIDANNLIPEFILQNLSFD